MTDNKYYTDDFAELCIMLGCSIEHNENILEKPFSKDWTYEQMLELAHELYEEWKSNTEYKYKNVFVHDKVYERQKEFEKLDK